MSTNNFNNPNKPDKSHNTNNPKVMCFFRRNERELPAALETELAESYMLDGKACCSPSVLCSSFMLVAVISLMHAGL